MSLIYLLLSSFNSLQETAVPKPVAENVKSESIFKTKYFTIAIILLVALAVILSIEAIIRLKR